MRALAYLFLTLITTSVRDGLAENYGSYNPSLPTPNIGSSSPPVGSNVLPSDATSCDAVHDVFFDVLSRGSAFPRPGTKPKDLCDAITNCPVNQINYNIGWEYLCLVAYDSCVSNQPWYGGSGCQTEYKECLSKAKSKPKFQCHDFAYEFCTYMTGQGYPTWILDLCDTGKPSGHTLNIISDSTYPYGSNFVRYCLVEPQGGGGTFGCWVQEAGTAPVLPESAQDELKKRYPEQAHCNAYKPVACDDKFYPSHDEVPWWECANGAHPSQIPAYCGTGVAPPLLPPVPTCLGNETLVLALKNTKSYRTNEECQKDNKPLRDGVEHKDCPDGSEPNIRSSGSSPCVLHDKDYEKEFRYAICCPKTEGFNSTLHTSPTNNPPIQSGPGH